MLRCILFALLILAGFSCKSQHAQKQDNSVNNKEDSISNSMLNSEASKSKEETNKLMESFSDDSTVGSPGKNKIELFMFEGSKENFVEIKFYSLTKDKTWELKQTFKQEKYGSLSCDVQFKDFNNDGFNDVTYVSGIAARGANEIRNLLIYDTKNDQLVYIKNSNDYPNLLYNKVLDCIDSQGFTGSTSTSFLKIEDDILREFARVDTLDTSKELRIYLIDKNGKEKLLRTDKIKEDDFFARYKTFNPPTQYEAEELER